jgi:hypothetical protein
MKRQRKNADIQILNLLSLLITLEVIYDGETDCKCVPGIERCIERVEVHW